MPKKSLTASTGKKTTTPPTRGIAVRRQRPVPPQVEGHRPTNLYIGARIDIPLTDKKTKRTVYIEAIVKDLRAVGTDKWRILAKTVLRNTEMSVLDSDNILLY